MIEVMTDMTKRFFLPIAVFMLGIGLTACQSTQTTDSTTGPTTGDSSRSRNMALEMANRALAELSYSPNNKGWDYKATAVPAADFQKWATANKAAIENALSQIETGYVLQITGHTCSIGPRDRQPDGRPGNIYYSTARARQVMAALRNAGIPTDKMTAVGVADDEPARGVSDPKSQLHRRVTFKIVKKQ
jgi:hypothetical protein